MTNALAYSRIGVQIAPNDPFWVQVHETLQQELGTAFAPFEIIDRAWYLTDEQMDELSQEILSNEFDAFICMILPQRILLRLLENGLPVICVEDEIELTHPRFSSVRGWYDAGMTVARYLATALDGRGRVLCLTGNKSSTHNLDFNRRRLAGIRHIFNQHPAIEVQLQPTFWDYPAAYAQLRELMAAGELTPPDAVLGLSDSMALAAMRAGEATGFLSPSTFIAGINGEPTALVPLYKGRMQATVNIRAEEFAGQAVKLARQAARGEALPPRFTFSTELITAANVAQVSIAKLDAVAGIPARLVGINRKTEERRLLQYEISASINRSMAVLKDRADLIRSITELLRIQYGYDRVYFYTLSDDATDFVLGNPQGAPAVAQRISLGEETMLREVYQRREARAVADLRYSGERFSADPTWRTVRSRVILPVRFGEDLLGLLDLQSESTRMHLRDELLGLQLLADQLGVALHNAALYAEALQARAAAERADQLKTRLLANVSHELRAPLNVILGYSQALLDDPRLRHADNPPDIVRDVGHVLHSGEHLLRLINDLLDVSRAEIGALDLFPETLAPLELLRDVFESMRMAYGEESGVDQSASGSFKVAWGLELPSQLPLIRADAVRLRQILLNLLSNAHKFTEEGAIVLGAEVAAPYLHIWVRDTGIGIGEAHRQHIFEPFMTGTTLSQRTGGIGLGLNITRRLVLLHEGKLTVDSRPGAGSTFHIYLPLPNLADQPLRQAPMAKRNRAALLAIAADRAPNPQILTICAQQGLEYYPLRFVHEVDAMPAALQPVAIAWDMEVDTPQAWQQIERIRAHPALNTLPFLLYQRAEPESAATDDAAATISDSADATDIVTNIMTKPLQPTALYDYLQSLRPPPSDDDGRSPGDAPILVVDDDPESRALYVRLLKQNFGTVEIVEAADGRAALQLLAVNRFSLILLDLMLPEIDGFTVLETIRTHEATRRVPVIVISGKVLTLEDVRKLDYANVLYQRKKLLSEEEAAACLQRVFGGSGELLPQPTSLLVKQALAFLQQNYAQSISRQEIAAAVNTNPSNLSRIFSQEVGITLWDFLARLRIQQAQELLLDPRSAYTITDIALRVGYNDPAYFSKVFKQQTGVAPVAFRRERG